MENDVRRGGGKTKVVRVVGNVFRPRVSATSRLFRGVLHLVPARLLPKSHVRPFVRPTSSKVCDVKRVSAVIYQLPASGALPNLADARWHTSESIHVRSSRTAPGWSCRCVRSRARAGRRGWGQSAWSR